MQERKRFAGVHRKKPASFWTSSIHMAIDVKLFKVYLNGDHVQPHMYIRDRMPQTSSCGHIMFGYQGAVVTTD